MEHHSFFVAAAFLSTVAHAQADYAREQRWAEEITPGVVVGDAVQLEAAGRKFLVLYAPSGQARSGIVIVHGLGVHPEWGLISPLRSGLADRGYATLSVQMPVLAADAEAERYAALFPEAAERLTSVVAFSRARHGENRDRCAQLRGAHDQFLSEQH